MSKQTLDDIMDPWIEKVWDKRALKNSVKALIRQEQLSLLKRLLEKKEKYSIKMNLEHEIEQEEAVPTQVIELEIWKLSQPTEGGDRE